MSDVTVVEGQAGSATAAFAVMLSAPTTLAVIVGYATTNGTASAGSDYLTVTGTLTFAPGATAATAGVSVLGDLLPEANAVFHYLEADLSMKEQALQRVQEPVRPSSTFRTCSEGFRVVKLPFELSSSPTVTPARPTA